jgi:hypothetical protein
MSSRIDAPRPPEMTSIDPREERVIYRERFQSVEFDFRGKIVIARYDCCEFVKCTLMINAATQQLAFTACVFKDCNVDQLRADEDRGLYAVNNIFDRPIDERRADFEKRLAQVIAARKEAGQQ